MFRVISEVVFCGVIVLGWTLLWGVLVILSTPCVFLHIFSNHLIDILIKSLKNQYMSDIIRTKVSKAVISCPSNIIFCWYFREELHNQFRRSKSSDLYAISYLNFGPNPCHSNEDDACRTEGLIDETSHDWRHLDLIFAPLPAPSGQTLTRPCIHVNKCMCISMSGGVLCSLRRSILGLEIAV